ncbi:hypothetical protein AB0L71_10315 [Streptomyces sp. NPDC052052]|uniref:hypothetical protein n=1 Tax=Streptomyces sp. NPDC052052 TaxID=3154756 RepID=UPI00341545EE
MSALVVVLPVPWVPLSHTITGLDTIVVRAAGKQAQRKGLREPPLPTLKGLGNGADANKETARGSR